MGVEPSPPVLLVRDFINTAEPQLGTDQLVASTAVESLQRLGLVTAAEAIDDLDLALLVGVREGLRQVLLDHAGHHVQESTRSELDGLLRSVPVTIRLDAEHAAVTAVEESTAHQVVAAILSAVIAVPLDEWTRLKVCARDSCRWAFFDASRNRSGRWCSMAGCGNIVKMRRAYQTRTAGASSEAAEQS